MSLGASPILNGQMAMITLDNKIVGLFSSISYSVSYATTVSHVLGRTGPAAVTYTAAEAVSLQLTGFQVVDTSAYEINAMPQLKQLMSHPGIVVQIIKRDDPTTIILQANDLKINNLSSGLAARSIADITVSGIASVMSFQGEDGAEAPNAVRITDGT